MKKATAILILTLTLLVIITTSIANADGTSIQAYESEEQIASSDAIGFWDFLNINSGGIIAVATVLYLGATIGILLSSRSQIEQLQKHHIQNVGYQMLDKRAVIMQKLMTYDFLTLNLPEVTLLFDQSISEKIFEIFAKNVKLEMKVRYFKSSLASKKNINAELLESINYHLDNAQKIFIMPHMSDLFLSMIDTICDSTEISARSIEYLRATSKEIVENSLAIFSLAKETIESIKDFTQKSIFQ